MEEEKTTNWIDLEDLGIELGTVKLKKNEFFRIMEKDFPEGTRLTIANVGNTYESKFRNKNTEDRNAAFFIDYTFKFRTTSSCKQFCNFVKVKIIHIFFL